MTPIMHQWILLILLPIFGNHLILCDKNTSKDEEVELKQNLCQVLEDKSAKLQSLALVSESGTLGIIINDHVYQVPVEQISNKRIILLDQTGKPIESRAKWWQDLQYFIPPEVDDLLKPESLSLNQLNIFHYNSNRYLHYVFEENLHSFAENWNTEKRVDPKTFLVDPEARYTAIDGFGGEGYFMELNQTSGNVTMRLLVVNETDEPIPRDTFTYDVLRLDQRWRKKKKKKSRPVIAFFLPHPEEPHINDWLGEAYRVSPMFSQPLMGFILNEYCHIWDFAKRQVYVFLYIQLGETTHSDNVKTKYTTIPMKSYFKC